MAYSARSPSREDYTIGWVCVVKPELVAARAMMDDEHAKLPAVEGDTNSYRFGSIRGHNVVILTLPSGSYGTNAAAVATAQMSRSFRGLRFYLLVGVGGGVPRFTKSETVDIRLGDVVVSDPTDISGGVIQYDLGKTKEGERWPVRTRTLDKPPPIIRSAVADLKAYHGLKGSALLEEHFAHLIRRYPHLKTEYAHQGAKNDILFEAGSKHEGQDSSCAKCRETKEVVPRTDRESSQPRIHYGTIASGNQVIKDSFTRDHWRQTDGVLCFEMEAAGMMDNFPCLVIRGVCDYADSHKNKSWQPYAAAAAAAYAKDLLCEMAPTDVHGEKPLGQLGTIGEATGNVHWMVPRSPNKLFTGRSDILEKLDLAFTSQCESQKRFVVVGEGGIGKSEVCLKYANDHREQFWGIFWIDASSPETAKHAFKDIGRLGGANSEDFGQVKMWLANTRYRWLLVIDNADSLDVDYAEYFPSGNKGNILLTTRNKQCVDHETIGYDSIDYLGREDANRLLLKAAGNVALSKERSEAAGKLVQALGFHTLAIIQAGAYIKRGSCSLEDYPTQFKKQQDRMLKYYPKQAQSTYRSVYATFEMSAIHMEASHDPSAIDALSLLPILAFFRFEQIPELVFSRAWEHGITLSRNDRDGSSEDKDITLSSLQVARLPFVTKTQENVTSIDLVRWREALILLETYSIIKIGSHSGDRWFSLHPLTHTWTKIRLSPKAQKEGWIATGSTIALSMRELENQLFFEKLRSHVRAFLDHQIVEYMGELPAVELCQTLYWMGYLLYFLRDSSKLKSLLQTLSKIQWWAGASEIFSLNIQHLNALSFMIGGRYDRAVKLLEHVVNVYMRLLEPEDPTRLKLQLDHGGAYTYNNQYKQAVEVLGQVLKIRERLLEPEHAALLDSQHELASAYSSNRQYERAVELLERVVEARERYLEQEHADLLTSQHELARAYLGNGQYERAVELLERVVEASKRSLEQEHPDILISQHALAIAYLGNGQHKKAVELLEEVVQIEARTLEPEHPEHLKLQHNLARAYMGLDKTFYRKAVELLEEVVQIKVRTLEPDDPERIVPEELLAEVYERMKVVGESSEQGQG